VGKPGYWTTIFTSFVILAATAISSPAQSFTTLASFNGTDGADPEYGPLVQGRDGNFYGTTYLGGIDFSGGDPGSGTVFKITPKGSLTTLCSFGTLPNCTGGSLPWGGLVLATNGNFYGTTSEAGANGWGTIFKITPKASLTPLYSFCAQTNCTDGAAPVIGLVQASDGNFYGTTQTAAIFGNSGTIFKITPGRKFTTLHTFCAQPGCPDGADPGGPLIQAADGNLYGTTGGGYGTIFKITLGGKLTTLYTFCAQLGCADGTVPFGPLVQGTDGNFYGTTTQGGTGTGCPFGCGTIFKFTNPGNVLTTLHNFDGNDGSLPMAGLIQGTDGNFYGTAEEGGGSSACGTFGCGTVFQVTPDGTLSTLRIFQGPPDGSFPAATLLQATNGNFYGTTIWGGTGNCSTVGCGMVFSFSTGLGPFVSFVQKAAKVGQSAQILGQRFKGTSKVSFNGMSASFTIKTGTFLTAKVPAGATTGYVTVTTPTGTLTSNVPFQVIP
jgi:uncharacterized repeat protein (TIGR03803 family)